MHWYRVLPVVALAGRLAAYASPLPAAGGEGSSDRAGAAALAAVSRPPVLHSEEPRESVMVRLPGPVVRPAPVKTVPAPPVPTLIPFKPPVAGSIPPVGAPLVPPPATIAARTPAPLVIPSAPKPIDPAVVASVPAPTPKLSATALVPPPVLPVVGTRPAPKGIAKPILPADFARDSAMYSQKRIAEWSSEDAYNLFGEALRERPAYDEERNANGTILAYADPTGRYRELELDFAADTGLLRTVFVYPWKMNWQDCRKLWGTNVSSTDATQGRIFYSYLNRRVDVLVDATGRVISLGLY